MEKSKLVSLGELSIELGINKSQLAYYSNLGLLTKVSTIGNTNVFDKASTLKKIAKIKKLKNSGKSLEQIKELL